jgi:hypothetical protein
MTKGFEMRKLLALMVLFCGTASADAAKTQKPDAVQPPETWCSDGFDKPTELLITAGKNFVLKIAGTPDETLDKVKDTIYPASIRNLLKGSSSKEYPVWIVRDRVFWPCDG